MSLCSTIRWSEEPLLQTSGHSTLEGLSQPCHRSPYPNLPTTSLDSSPKVVPSSLLTTSSRLGCVKTASVFLATLCPARAFPPRRTKCGTALNFPPVITCSASPVWKARQSGGIETFVIVKSRA